MGLLPVVLVACSEHTERHSPEARPKTKAVYVSPLQPTKDPQIMKGQQVALVDMMIHDPHVDLASIEGEAYRRGVTLTPEQVAFKKAHPVDRNAPISPTVGVPASTPAPMVDDVNPAAPDNATS